MKLRTTVPAALAVGTLTAGGLVLTGRTAWIPALTIGILPPARGPAR